MERFRVDQFNNIIIDAVPGRGTCESLVLSDDSEQNVCHVIHNDLKGVCGRDGPRNVTFGPTLFWDGEEGVVPPLPRRSSMVPPSVYPKNNRPKYSTILNVARRRHKTENCCEMDTLHEENRVDCNKYNQMNGEEVKYVLSPKGTRTDIGTNTHLEYSPQSAFSPHKARRRRPKPESDAHLDKRMLHLSQRKALEAWMQKKLNSETAHVYRSFPDQIPSGTVYYSICTIICTSCICTATVLVNIKSYDTFTSTINVPLV